MASLGFNELTWTFISFSVIRTAATQQWTKCYVSLLWRHNWGECISNHQPHDCLLNRLFGRWSKKTSKLCVAGLCVVDSPETGEFPAQMASNAEIVSIWWRQHVQWCFQQQFNMPLYKCFNTLRGRQMGTRLQTTFAYAFSLLKYFQFQIKFHWNIFLVVWLIDTEPPFCRRHFSKKCSWINLRTRYLNHLWPSFLYAPLGPNALKIFWLLLL